MQYRVSTLDLIPLQSDQPRRARARPRPRARRVFRGAFAEFRILIFPSQLLFPSARFLRRFCSSCGSDSSGRSAERRGEANRRGPLLRATRQAGGGGKNKREDGERATVGISSSTFFVVFQTGLEIPRGIQKKVETRNFAASSRLMSRRSFLRLFFPSAIPKSVLIAAGHSDPLFSSFCHFFPRRS